MNKDASEPRSQEGLVETLYSNIRAMAVDFRLRPGERVNEVVLSRALNASRTPLREALNRLVAEGFLTFESGKGFFCRTYSVTEIQDLYQLRQAIERFAVQLAVEHASDGALDELGRFLDRTAGEEGRSPEELLAWDEHFHETIAGLAGNAELLRTLRNINARIRFFRWVDMESRRGRTQGEHRAILSAIAARDAAAAGALMDEHIVLRREEIAQAVRECHARLFADEDYRTPEFKTMDEL